MAEISNYQSRNSDVDFNDVFGGPPRRSSTQEYCDNERTASIEFSGIDDGKDETEGSQMPPWFSLREKPVFGDEVVQRRRYPSNDFFDDVFRGDHPTSSCSQSSPRVIPPRNPFASAPHSRVMSPSRSSEPLPSPDFLRFKRSIKIQHEGMGSFCKSIDLSHEIFGRRKEAAAGYSTQLNGMDDHGRPQAAQSYPKSSLVGRADHIHFSFHKWPSNGVPIVVFLKKRRPKLNEKIQHDTVNDTLESPSKIKKSNPKPLRSFFERPEHDDEASTMYNDHSNKEKLQEYSSRKMKKDRMKGSDIKGKVKGLVDNFNQEYRSKNTREVEGGRNVNDDNTINNAANETTANAPMSLKKEMHATFDNFEEAWTDISELVDGTSFTSGPEQFRASEVNNVTNTDDPITVNEPNDDFVRSSSANINIAPPNMNNVEMLENEYLDSNQAYQTKVSHWAKGKEGNIRSLLSTLQLVLWENSGWKPIPLVEIIEANAVKRAYQKALLCLHPDKLQQKGATSDHKFVAEKVFDILQEAWDHFNSLSHL